MDDLEVQPFHEIARRVAEESGRPGREVIGGLVRAFWLGRFEAGGLDPPRLRLPRPPPEPAWLSLPLHHRDRRHDPSDDTHLVELNSWFQRSRQWHLDARAFDEEGCWILPAYGHDDLPGTRAAVLLWLVDSTFDEQLVGSLPSDTVSALTGGDGRAKIARGETTGITDFENQCTWLANQPLERWGAVGKLALNHIAIGPAAVERWRNRSSATPSAERPSNRSAPTKVRKRSAHMIDLASKRAEAVALVKSLFSDDNLKSAEAVKREALVDEIMKRAPAKKWPKSRTWAAERVDEARGTRAPR